MPRRSVGQLWRGLVIDNPFLQLALQRVRRRLGFVLLQLSAFILLLALAMWVPLLLMPEVQTGPLDRGAAALAALSWMHLILLWGALSRGESLVDDTLKQRLDFLKLCPQSPLRWVAQRAVFPAVRGVWLTMHALPFYAFCWQLGGADPRPLVIFLLLVFLMGLRAGVTKPASPFYLLFIGQWFGRGFGASMVRNLVLFPIVIADWVSRPQSWFALWITPLPIVIAWLAWGGLNSVYDQTLPLALLGQSSHPTWLLRWRPRVLQLILFILVGYAWQPFIVNGKFPSLWQAWPATLGDALGGLFLFWLLVIGKPNPQPAVSTTDEDESEEEEEPEAARKPPPPPERGWVRDAFGHWCDRYGYASLTFAGVLLLAWTSPGVLGWHWLVGTLFVTVVVAAVIQCRRWRDWLMTGLRAPRYLSIPLFAWQACRLLAVLAALAEPLGLPRELAVLSPMVALMARSPFADDWDRQFDFLQLPAQVPLWIIVVLIGAAELVEIALTLLSRRMAQPLEESHWEPPPDPLIQWRSWEQRLLERWDNPIFRNHYARWRRTTPQLPARWVTRLALLVIVVPLALTPWLAPLWPALVVSIGVWRTMLAAATLVGLMICVLLSMSPIGFVGDRLWRERASGFFESVLLVPMSEREIVGGWLGAGVIGVLPCLAPVALVTSLAALTAIPFIEFPVVVIGALLTLPALALTALLIDASTAWQLKEIDFAKQSHAGGVIQVAALLGLLVSVMALGSLVFYGFVAAFCVLVWLIVPVLWWMVLRQLRKLRRRWGETYAARAP